MWVEEVASVVCAIEEAGLVAKEEAWMAASACVEGALGVRW